MNDIIDVESTEITKSKRHRMTKREKLMATAINAVNYDDVNTLDENYQELIKTDKKYSLEIDPCGLYNMSSDQITFIKNYLDTRNIDFACRLSGFVKYDKDGRPFTDTEKGIEIYNMYSTQQEIRRINVALKARQFSTKMLGINEIGGYLSSLVTDENVPAADRLYGKDKLAAAKMLIELNEIKKQAYDNPNTLDVIDIESNIKDLSVKSIKELIRSSYDTSKVDEKTELIEQIDKDKSLSAEEINVLRGMSKEELLDLLEDINRKD